MACACCRVYMVVRGILSCRDMALTMMVVREIRTVLVDRMQQLLDLDVGEVLAQALRMI